MVRTKVDICGLDTATLPIFTNEQMRSTFREFQSGSEEAKEALIMGNLRLVLSLVQRFAFRGEQVDDLFQVGCIGLIKSIDNFDLSHNVRFSTYAVPMIIGEIKRHLRDHHPVRVSRSLRDIAYKAMKAKEQFVLENLREPTISDIAKMIELEEEDILLALDAIQDPISLEEPIFHENGDPVYMLDQLKDSEVSEESWSNYVLMKEMMGRLGAREQKILAKRYYYGETQTEIAKELGLSQAQISRLEKNALGIMQEEFSSYN
ncbi:RNA polymerase sporulation sigma factor SigG [Paenisporosarcina cavernae]|uniref:RNA polymerase sigma factor n=1 Tax=Paenisporosarcina cavernae TaxID=2320858 RepID=A0A385YS12_9BACL|nr:RNA polymerase sporulation sigma factor SigG [Paenisporosarcina cavernae]AYC29170.1 RNA polymerase sporulation sigma factor SigG [Paenisporosarcina cavernae]